MTEGIDRRDWTAPEALDAFFDARANELHVALPGRVESYDADEQTADITPMAERPLERRDGTLAWERFPTLRAVPVVQRRATVGGWFVHMPIAAGDEVVIHVLERDYSRWRQTGDVSRTPDTRLHHLAHAIAYPGLPSRANLLSNLPSDAMVIGKVNGLQISITGAGAVEVGGASDAAGLASLIDQQLNDLKTAITGWTPVTSPAGDGAASLKVALTDWLADTAATASAILKVDS